MEQYLRITSMPAASVPLCRVAGVQLTGWLRATAGAARGTQCTSSSDTAHPAVDVIAVQGCSSANLLRLHEVEL